MEQSVLLWILGTAVTLLTLAIGGIIRLMVMHSRDCMSHRIEDATHRGAVDAKLERIMADIGSHESGIRGSLHKLRDDISPFIVMAQMEMERREKR